MELNYTKLKNINNKYKTDIFCYFFYEKIENINYYNNDSISSPYTSSYNDKIKYEKITTYYYNSKIRELAGYIDYNITIDDNNKFNYIKIIPINIELKNNYDINKDIPNGKWYNGSDAPIGGYIKKENFEKFDLVSDIEAEKIYLKLNSNEIINKLNIDNLLDIIKKIVLNNFYNIKFIKKDIFNEYIVFEYKNEKIYVGYDNKNELLNIYNKTKNNINYFEKYIISIINNEIKKIEKNFQYENRKEFIYDLVENTLLDYLEKDKTIDYSELEINSDNVYCVYQIDNFNYDKFYMKYDEFINQYFVEKKSIEEVKNNIINKFVSEFNRIKTNVLNKYNAKNNEKIEYQNKLKDNELKRKQGILAYCVYDDKKIDLKLEKDNFTLKVPSWAMSYLIGSGGKKIKYMENLIKKRIKLVPYEEEKCRFCFADWYYDY